MRLPRLFLLAGSALLPPLAFAQTPGPDADLVGIYKSLHEHPELSHFEEHTSALVASELRKAGYTVTDHIGKYPDGSGAYGVVAILRNGPGSTLLVRADMDALPIAEETGVPYASHVVAQDKSGQQVPVMHACGHDVHTTVLIGTARVMAASRDQWHGTLMLVGQPSEETGDGAKAMLADHLYERFGKPDLIIGLHDTNRLPAGKVAVIPGDAQAGSTAVDVVIHGIGGHGAAPEAGRDPITLAALYIAQIQTIVSREEDPQDPAVVTVGSIHGGTKRNIIPDEVKLQLTTRYFSAQSRQRIITGLQQMAAGITASAGLPPEKAATVTVLEDESTPVQHNDLALTARERAIFEKTFGAENVVTLTPLMTSEDVGMFGLDGKIPMGYFRIGAIYPDRFAQAEAQGKLPPGLHTSKFEPDPEPTITTGVKAMAAVATTLLQ